MLDIQIKQVPLTIISYFSGSFLYFIVHNWNLRNNNNSSVKNQRQRNFPLLMYIYFPKTHNINKLGIHHLLPYTCTTVCNQYKHQYHTSIFRQPLYTQAFFLPLPMPVGSWSWHSGCLHWFRSILLESTMQLCGSCRNKNCTFTSYINTP